jgi:hypothetical protein
MPTTIAKRPFSEPEHGGSIYFLRAANGKAYGIFDSESQDRGAGNEDPLRSAFQPKARFCVVRAPHSRVVLSSRFAGQDLPLPPPKDLNVAPSEWPESDEYCAIAWHKLEVRLT